MSGITKSFEDENTEALNFFLEQSFYKAWRTDGPQDNYLGNYDNLELMINNKCNLQCKYCYMSKFGQHYFPKGTQSSTKILHNTDLLIDWLYENNFTPALEFFAGDSLTDPICRQMAHKMLDAALEGRRVAKKIIFPTNMGWLTNEKRWADVHQLIEKSEYAGMPMFVSASVDGLFMEENRPFKSNKSGYTDEYYDKLFSFLAANPSSGIHPMIYSNKVERWIENFLWWQEKYKEYHLDWRHMYFLEVRNVEWTLEQVKHYMEFIKFLVRWSYSKCNENPDDFIKFMFKQGGFNILPMGFSHIGRGMPCSIQSCITLRVGDLTVIPCHRTAYKHMETAQFRVENDKIVGLDAKNIELWFAIQALENTQYPYCEKCAINSLCKGGCLGSQYEVTGNVFTPIPTVCRLFHAKVAALISVFKELGIYSNIVMVFSTDKQTAALRNVENILEEQNGI